jgi:hypothetical protein
MNQKKQGKSITHLVGQISAIQVTRHTFSFDRLTDDLLIAYINYVLSTASKEATNILLCPWILRSTHELHSFWTEVFIVVTEAGSFTPNDYLWHSRLFQLPSQTYPGPWIWCPELQIGENKLGVHPFQQLF